MARATKIEPIVLTIIDGWGNRAEAKDNAIANAKTPIFDRLAARGIRTMLAAGGEAVGLPANHPGNAEAGHRTIGTGRTQPQFASRVADAINAEGSERISDNKVLQALVQKARNVGGNVHLMGLISPAGVQGHQYHLAVLAALLSHEGIQVSVHAILDGEDDNPQAGADHLAEFLRDIEGTENVTLATVMGRRYALDRLHRPTHLTSALQTISEAETPITEYPVSYIASCYDKGLSDADVPPAAINGYSGLRQDDILLLALLRADSAGALMAGLLGDESAVVLPAHPVQLSAAYSLTPLARPLDQIIQPLFEEHQLTGTLSEALAAAGKRQLYLSDAVFPMALGSYHLGGRIAPFDGEKHIRMTAPKRASFDKKPELAALELAHEAVAAVKTGEVDVLIVHFPNIALAAHSGDEALTRKAAEVIDKALGKITAILEKKGGTLMIVGSHGNAEDMSPTQGGTSNSRNTRAAVPLIIDGPRDLTKTLALKPGQLSDVAPTLLSLLEQDAPREMTGQSLLVSNDAVAHAVV